jgi:hypothetical protein
VSYETMKEAVDALNALREEAWTAGYNSTINRDANPYPLGSYEWERWDDNHRRGSYQRGVDDWVRRRDAEIIKREDFERARREQKKWWQFWI